MNIITALMKEDLRITNGDKWLFWDVVYEKWVVCQRKYRGKQTVYLIRTDYQDEAIEELLKD